MRIVLQNFYRFGRGSFFKVTQTFFGWLKRILLSLAWAVVRTLTPHEPDKDERSNVIDLEGQNETTSESTPYSETTPIMLYQVSNDVTEVLWQPNNFNRNLSSSESPSLNRRTNLKDRLPVPDFDPDSDNVMFRESDESDDSDEDQPQVLLEAKGPAFAELKNFEKQIHQRAKELKDLYDKKYRINVPSFSSVWERVGSIRKRYEFQSMIGCGYYSQTAKMYDTELEKDVAVKIFRICDDWTEGKRVFKELYVLNRISKNTIQPGENFFPGILDAFVLDEYFQEVAITYELYPSDLKKLFRERLNHEKSNKEKNKSYLNEAEIKIIFFNLLRAVGLLHGKNVIHRDIRPANVLIREDATVYLSDFVFADVQTGGSKNKDPGLPCPDTVIARNVDVVENIKEKAKDRLIQSAPYRPPEFQHINSLAPIKPSADVWSVGCIFGELLMMKEGNKDGLKRGQLFPITTQRERSGSNMSDGGGLTPRTPQVKRDDYSKRNRNNNFYTTNSKLFPPPELISPRTDEFLSTKDYSRLASPVRLAALPSQQLPSRKGTFYRNQTTTPVRARSYHPGTRTTCVSPPIDRIDRSSDAVAFFYKELENFDFKIRFPGEDAATLEYLKLFLAYYPQERITIDKAINHGYFQSSIDDEVRQKTLDEIKNIKEIQEFPVDNWDWDYWTICARILHEVDFFHSQN